MVYGGDNTITTRGRQSGLEKERKVKGKCSGKSLPKANYVSSHNSGVWGGGEKIASMPAIWGFFPKMTGMMAW